MNPTDGDNFQSTLPNRYDDSERLLLICHPAHRTRSPALQS